MTPDQVKNRLEALRWFDIYINILKDKIVSYDREIAKQKKQGRSFDSEEMLQDFTKERLQQVIKAKETILRFVKLYADSEDDYKLLIMHFFERKTYVVMAEELHYSERNVTRIVTKAIKAITENAKDADAKDFPY